jgi:hypothetical protein
MSTDTANSTWAHFLARPSTKPKTDFEPLHEPSRLPSLPFLGGCLVVSERAHNCRRTASAAERNARSATAGALRLTYLDLARRWREIAEQVEMQEGLLRQDRSRAYPITVWARNATVVEVYQP